MNDERFMELFTNKRIEIHFDRRMNVFGCRDFRKQYTKWWIRIFARRPMSAQFGFIFDFVIRSYFRWKWIRCQVSDFALTDISGNRSLRQQFVITLIRFSYRAK